MHRTRSREASKPASAKCCIQSTGSFLSCQRVGASPRHSRCVFASFLRVLALRPPVSRELRSSRRRRRRGYLRGRPWARDLKVSRSRQNTRHPSFVAMVNDTHASFFRQDVETATDECDEFSGQRSLRRLVPAWMWRHGHMVPWGLAGDLHGCPDGCRVNMLFTTTTCCLKCFRGSVEDLGPEGNVWGCWLHSTTH